jgi:hypothetical protein
VGEEVLVNPILLFYVLAAIVLRLLPHPWNLAPVGAMFLFSAATFRTRLQGWLVPLAALVVSDFFTAQFLHHGQGMFNWMVWISFSVVGLVGWILRSKITPLRVAGTAIAGGLTFFIVVDFGLWLGGHMYPKTFTGLLECYIAALPFLRNDVIGNLVYCAIMFGSYAWIESRRRVNAVA